MNITARTCWLALMVLCLGTLMIALDTRAQSRASAARSSPRWGCR